MTTNDEQEEQRHLECDMAIETFPYERKPRVNWWDKDDSNNASWRKINADIILEERTKAYWNVYYDKICDFIELKVGSNNLRIMEIGTAYGGQGMHFAKRFPSSTILAIDPLLAGYDNEDAHSAQMVKWMKSQRLTKEGFSDGWADALIYNQLSANKCIRYHMVKEYSTTALQKYIDVGVDKFDVIFVDGLHSYEGVVADIDLASQLIKPHGGVLIFNDYRHPNFPGVTRAVDEFVASQKAGGATLVVGDDTTPPGPTNAAIQMS